MINITLFNQSTLTELVLLLVAFILSAIIGMERQRQLKSAGLRTHTLVGLGSAVFTLVSAYGFSNVLGADVTLDPSRIAAQVVSGIGFLGAGVIFVRQNVVNGLTTAASIWVTAAIGMACGAGMPVLAVATTALYIVAVVLLTRLSHVLPAINEDEAFVIQYKENRGALGLILARATGLGYKASLSNTRTIESPGKAMRVEATMNFTHSKHRPIDDLVEALSELKGVTSVQVGKSESS